MNTQKDCPPKRAIAFETLIPPPPASYRGDSHRIFCSGTNPLKRVLLSNAGLTVNVTML